MPNKSGMGLGLGISGQSIANKELQASHLRAITGAGKEEKDSKGQNPFSSQIQIPLSQKRQGTGQKIIDNNVNKASMKSYKNLPQSSQGYGGQSRLKNDDLVIGRTSSVYNGIPKPSAIHSAVSRQQQNSQQNTHHS